MQRLRQCVDRVLEQVLIGIMAAMVFNVIWQVFTRFVLRNPSSYTEELARYLLIWLGLLGASYCVSRQAHLSVDVFTARLTGPGRLLVRLSINVSIVVFALAVLVIGGARLVTVTLGFRQTSAALQVELGYVYLVLPISGILMLFYAATDLWQNLSKLKRGEVD